MSSDDHPRPADENETGAGGLVLPGAGDDALARALAEAGITGAEAEAPGSDDPLARALAAAGVAAPAEVDRPASDDPLARAMARVFGEPEAPPADPMADALTAAGLAGVLPGEQSTPVAPARSVVTSATDESAAAPEPVVFPAGVATGVGSMPGEDVREAAAIVVGEVPLMPSLPELPGRGVGADMIGRTAALLVDLAVDLRPSGYRVSPRPGRDMHRAVDLLRGDLDTFEEACDPVHPGWIKLQAAGPWTLAAAVELQSGHRVLTDRGAVREFAGSLAEGLRAHAAELAARTGAKVLLQLDEPSLPAVLAGRLPTPSGYGTVRAVPGPDAQEVLREVIATIGVPVAIHCCADFPPIRLLAGVGAAAVGIDATRPALSGTTAQVKLLDQVGEAWDAGTPLLLGVIPSTAPAGRVTSRTLAGTAFDLADRLGFDRARLPQLAIPTPACGLAGASPAWARQALAFAREIGENLVDPPEAGAPDGDREADER